MRTKIVAGNWKMNCNLEEAFSLASEIAGMVKDEQLNNATVILAPPFVYLSGIIQIVKGTGIKVAAQNCSYESQGAYTGEVAASMLKSVGADYVIIGHSERRLYFNETAEDLSKKTNLALLNGLIPVFCVGETLPERESGQQRDVVAKQLNESLFSLSAESFSKVVIAYEPVWAIGTGKTATPEQAQEMHLFIRNHIEKKYGSAIAAATPVLYGGSCNENNARELFSLPDVDGGLIGGASLKSRSFVNIVKSF
jgi:triosephosphate isomerase